MNSNNAGVLVIVHGSSNPSWVKVVDEAIQLVDTALPITVGYLEFSEERSIEQGIRTFEKQGVDTILSIPLFVSSASTHIEEIKYALGQINTPVIETDLKPISTSANIIWVDPMDTHPLVLDIIMERVNSLSEYPEKEVLLFVAHGSDVPSFHQRWEKMLEDIKQTVAHQVPFHQVTHGTLHPDNLEERAKEAASNGHTLIVVPLFLSEGYFTKKVIPTRLDGLSYKWDAKTYLPHPLISKWIEDKVTTAL
ncbi:cobalamin biosynthesis protein CbiX [Salipaludibacillus neizhouensis]|uniref:Cobalamin biosynthesis protein CbiX n=1 Tax=Salipaludibacillus neizhouensis TaxID=885475 RepID=A0A3A9KDI9_9BACI|nr:CbiX/SirB N-terminal domain-containing protein [Salipaludibacillus neizhouensis]RKL68612.1 cobalamin biosynthesis protein CbiX [Salipaludibacillus neizhouensis]